MQSEINSRDTREYFIPSVPIEIASDTVGVPNVCGFAPAASRACTTASVSGWRPELQGVVVE